MPWPVLLDPHPQVRNLIDHCWMATTGGAWDEGKAAEMYVQLKNAIARAGEMLAYVCKIC